MTVRLRIRSASPPPASTVTLSPSMPTTVRPVRTVTPSFSGVLAPVVAEVRVVRATGDDDRVVREDGRRWNAKDRAKMYLARLEIEIGNLGHQNAHVPVSLEDRPQRIGDLAGGERPGRDL